MQKRKGKILSVQYCLTLIILIAAKHILRALNYVIQLHMQKFW